MLLVRFENAIHLWTLKSKVTVDEPPQTGILYAGLKVLFSLTGWRGDVRFVPGTIVSVQLDDRGRATYSCKRDGYDEELHERKELNIRLVRTS